MVNAGYDMNVYYKNAADFDGQVFLKYLVRNSNNGELNTDFDKLKAKLVDASPQVRRLKILLALTSRLRQRSRKDQPHRQ